MTFAASGPPASMRGAEYTGYNSLHFEMGLLVNGRSSLMNCGGVDLSKQQQLSDWGAEALTDAQLAYAASDVLHLHALRARLDAMLAREGREGLAAACFRFLPDRARLDLAGWAGEDIFAHS